MDSIWYKKIENQIIEQNEKLYKKDFKFYQVDTLLKLAKKADELSDNCQTCKHLKPSIEEIAENLSDYLKGDVGSRKKFEKKVDEINGHIRNVHKIYPSQFYLYTYSFAGIAIGILSGLLCSYPFGTSYLKQGIFIGFVSGLIAGRIIGKIRDKKLRSKGKILE